MQRATSILASILLVGVGVTSVAASEGQIVVDASRLDFGEVEVGEAPGLTVEIGNTGSGDLVVSTIALCAGTSEEYSWDLGTPLTIPSEGSETLLVTYAPEDIGRDEGCLVIQSDDPSSGTLRIDLTGRTPTIPGSDTCFRRADSNTDGTVDISDGIATLDFLFEGNVTLTCEDAADTNDDGTIDVSDPTLTFLFLFGDGSEPPAPGPYVCGPDLMVDDLDCQDYSGGECECPAGSTAVLQGVVTNSLTGLGLPGVEVDIVPSVVDEATITDENGAYSRDLAVGVYTVTFELASFESRTEVITLTPISGALDVALEPVSAVIVTAKTTGEAVPEGVLEATASVEVLDGSTVEGIEWRQLTPVEAGIENGDTEAATVTLATLLAYKDELFVLLAEPPIGEEDLPPNVELPEGEFPGGLQNRWEVVGLNPLVLEETGLVTLEVSVTTTSGTYSDVVDVHTHLPWEPSSGLRSVPIDLPVQLHGKSHVDEDGDGLNDATGAPLEYDWMLTAPEGSAAELADAMGQNPAFTPDVAGVYTVTVTDTTQAPGDELVTLEIHAGTWLGVIAGQDEDGRPVASEACTACHNGTIAPDKFTPWAQSGHAEILTNNLNTSTHYGPNCFGCHTVGYSPGSENGGIDEASDYQAFLDSGLLNNPGDNWTQMLEEFPASAQMANIQCENCHGPQTDGGHMQGEGGLRVDLSANVCATCHGEPLRHARFQQWQLSGHANYELAIDEGESGNCSRCHTANGFLEWLPVLEDDDPETDPLANIEVTWGIDETHPQTCAACHDPHNPGSTTGINTNATVRISGNTPPLIAGFTAIGVGRGAICMTCHNSRRGLRNDDVWDDYVGTSEAARAAHGSAQADVVMGQNVYLMNVGIRGSHSFVTDTCVNCHMERTPPPDLLAYRGGGTNHTFTARMDICSSCHGDAFEASGVTMAVETGLDELQGLVEDSIHALIAEQIDEGRTVDLNGDRTITDAAEITDVVFGEARGRQAITVTFADGETLGAYRLTDVDVVAVVDETPTVIGQLYDFADDRLPKAGWNWTLIHNDGSHGIHNPSFAFEALDVAIDALVALDAQPPRTALSGVVLDRNGEPVSRALVVASSPVSTTTTSSGRFSLEVTPGEHQLLITAADGVVLFDGTVTAVGGEDTAVDMGYVTYDPESDYAGKLTCKKCHSQDGLLGTPTYEIFNRSGHGYKLNPVVSGQAPTYPFSSIEGSLDLVGDAGEDVRIDKADGDAEVPGNGLETDNELGTPLSWDDVSFVIGGYGWKARFIDRDGFIATGSAVQYNLATQGVVGYHDNETNKPYNCGKCHTTGWQSLDENGGEHQDGLPGMHGTFVFPAIECEQCHGPGKAHANAPAVFSVVKDRSAELCGTCHTRDGQNRIAASGGLVRHHEQFDELIRLRINEAGDVIQSDGTVIPPDTPAETRLELAAQGKHYTMDLGCNVCHNPHATTKYDALTEEAGLPIACTNCHPDKVRAAGTGMTVGVEGAKVTCIDCHMPRMSKSAIAEKIGTEGEPTTGDIATHIFKIDLTQSEQFTADGKLAMPHITAEFACLTCHGGDSDVGSTIDLQEFNFETYTFHQ